MSQQLTTSATGGLLALNPSTSLQGPTSVGGEGALFSGFGALLTQQSSPSGTASEFHDGVFLPQTGIKLPSAVGEDAAEAATVQQQMLYIAQMLEQQAEGDVSPEVSAELAKALKQYVDQKVMMRLLKWLSCFLSRAEGSRPIKHRKSISPVSWIGSLQSLSEIAWRLIAMSLLSMM